MSIEDPPTPFQRMQYTKGLLVPCVACGRRLAPDWDHEGLCDGCREPDYQDYEEDTNDDED